MAGSNLLALFILSFIGCQIISPVFSEEEKQKCGEHQVFSACNAAPSCQTTCKDGEPITCTRNCVPGCICDKGFVLSDDGKCVPEANCPVKKVELTQATPECRANEEFLPCKRCEPSCLTPNPICMMSCTSGCSCKKEFVREGDNCIPHSKCPKDQASAASSPDSGLKADVKANVGAQVAVDPPMQLPKLVKPLLDTTEAQVKAPITSTVAAGASELKAAVDGKAQVGAQVAVDPPMQPPKLVKPLLDAKEPQVIAPITATVAAGAGELKPVAEGNGKNVLDSGSSFLSNSAGFGSIPKPPHGAKPENGPAVDGKAHVGAQVAVDPPMQPPKLVKPLLDGKEPLVKVPITAAVAAGADELKAVAEGNGKNMPNNGASFLSNSAGFGSIPKPPHGTKPENGPAVDGKTHVGAQVAVDPPMQPPKLVKPLLDGKEPLVNVPITATVAAGAGDLKVVLDGKAQVGAQLGLDGATEALKLVGPQVEIQKPVSMSQSEASALLKSPEVKAAVEEAMKNIVLDGSVPAAQVLVKPVIVESPGLPAQPPKNHPNEEKQHFVGGMKGPLPPIGGKHPIIPDKDDKDAAPIVKDASGPQKPEEPKGKCSQNERFLSCKVCDENCDEEPQMCTRQCVPGCSCVEGHVRDSNNQCVPKSQCKNNEKKQQFVGGMKGPLPPVGGKYPTISDKDDKDAAPIVKDASGLQKPEEPKGKCSQNERFLSCKVCDENCDEEPQMCTRQCVPGCSCVEGHVRDSNNQCVPKSQCKNNEGKQQSGNSPNQLPQGGSIPQQKGPGQNKYNSQSAGGHPKFEFHSDQSLENQKKSYGKYDHNRSQEDGSKSNLSQKFHKYLEEDYSHEDRPRTACEELKVTHQRCQRLLKDEEFKAVLDKCPN